MTLTHPLLLLLLLLLPYYFVLGRPVGTRMRQRAWTALILRCTIVSLVVLALAGLQAIRGSDQLGVVFLLDVSDSVSDLELERGIEFIDRALTTMRPQDSAALVVFGAEALVERSMVSSQQLDEITSIPLTSQTDLEQAIRLGLALFPEGMARRLVLLTDGRPTVGETEAAVRLARVHNAQLDLVAMDARLDSEIWLADLELPTQLHPGEEFSLGVTIESQTQTEAVLAVVTAGQSISQQAIQLAPGTNRFAIPMIAGEPGFAAYRAAISAAEDTYIQNNSLSAFAMIEGPPRVLLVASDSEEAAPLLEALEATGLEVEQIPPGLLPSEPAALTEYAAVILVDTPAQALTPRAMETVQSYVRDLGGGLVAVGGPDSYGVGGWYHTPLEETLPVAMTLNDPQRFPPMSIVIVIDKSGSMATQEGGIQKIRLAGEAAARVAELITDLDEITVIAFDDRPADVIGPLPGSQRELVIASVLRLRAGGGGIYVRESLREALDILQVSERPVRHIILLADGSDSEHQGGVPQMVTDEIADQGITLSSVAIGAGQDLGFLRQIAELGNGRYHFTDRAATLPVIFAQETQLAMRSYIIEEPFYPRQAAPSPILTGIDSVPQLLGYVATTPKPAAQVLLSTHQNDPLLAAWQYGLGRAVAWTSDATGRWAPLWVEWDDFPRFWAQVVRWTIAQQTDVPAEVTVHLQEDTARITLDVVDGQGQFVDGLETLVGLAGPAGFTSTLNLEQSAPGQYEGAFIPPAEGAYLLRVIGSQDGEESLALTTGWVLGYSPEYAALESDPNYISFLAELGEGRVLEEPQQAFEHTLAGSGTALPLWPYLLAVATLLLPLDVAVRRLAVGKRDLERFRKWVRQRIPQRTLPVADEPTQVSQLIQAKQRVDQPRRTSEIPEAEPPPLKEERPARIEPVPAPPIDKPESQDQTSSLASQLLRRKRERDQE